MSGTVANPQYVNLGSSISCSTDMTLAAWINVDFPDAAADGGRFDAILSKGGYNMWWLRRESDVAQCPLAFKAKFTDGTDTGENQ